MIVTRCGAVRRKNSKSRAGSAANIVVATTMKFANGDHFENHILQLFAAALDALLRAIVWFQLVTCQ